jgi:hypothetical protein
MKKWILMNGDTIIARVLSPTPPDHTQGIDVTNLEVLEVDELKPLDMYDFNKADRSWVFKLDLAKEKAIKEINDIREKQQMQVLTEGQAKSLVYSQKHSEVKEAQRIMEIPEVLDPEDFPFAKAKTLVTGQTLIQVLYEFRQGIKNSMLVCAEIEARSQKAQQMVDEAETSLQISEAINYLLS